MPPASNTPAREKEQLHRKFSAAANALADLYRESSNSYEAGYRDALLFVQRYLQSSSPITEHELAPSSAFSICETVNAQHMAQFLQNTIATRRERMAAVRGIHSFRRRRRESERGGSGVGDSIMAGEHGDAMESDEEEDGEERCLTPHPSPAANTESPTGLAALVASRVEGTATPDFSPAAFVVVNSMSPALNREMEHVRHLGHPVAERLPYQPRRQRPRMERTQAHCSVSFADGHPLSAQLRIGRRG
ncbi:hypothetical protein GH5_01685 [Leishmania sp. Ghana 2012 LV757]|uniref:hypothetical protein n=1 Tax=Leishmania sp. Ghana 2012 LV757 TaxID=2803181 RepID=UPI001B4DC188|nr:hypothetical protein GH5_01685 [Leishmania sp. Ghana 2012 LV757]